MNVSHLPFLPLDCYLPVTWREYPQRWQVLAEAHGALYFCARCHARVLWNSNLFRQICFIFRSSDFVRLSYLVFYDSAFSTLLSCSCSAFLTRRPSSADRTARRQFQATGQPVNRTQAAMTSRLPRYEAKCVQRRFFQWGSVPLRSDIKGTELPHANILIPLERQLIAIQHCSWQFLYNETLQQTFRPLLSKLSKRRQI